MNNLFDYNRLSHYVSGLVDRKLKAVTLAITSRVGFLQTLVIEAKGYRDTASTKAAQTTSDAADVKARMRSFFATYLGVNAADPVKSSLDDDVANGAFGIRSTNGRLRYATRDPQGALVWQDAKVAADAQSVKDICFPLFLALDKPQLQTIKGPVEYSKSPTIPDVTSWTSVESANARSVKSLVNNGLSLEAQARDAAIGVASANLTEDFQEDIASSINDAKAELAAKDAQLLETLQNFAKLFSRGSNYYGNWETRPGIVEMWGRSHQATNRETAVSFSFPLILPDVSYNFTGTPLINVANNLRDIWIQIIESSRTDRSMQIYYQSSTSDDQNIDGFEWRIICSVGFDYVVNENTGATGTGDSSGNIYGSNTGNGGSGGSGGAGGSPYGGRFYEIQLADQQ